MRPLAVPPSKACHERQTSFSLSKPSDRSDYAEDTAFARDAGEIVGIDGRDDRNVEDDHSVPREGMTLASAPMKGLLSPFSLAAPPGTGEIAEPRSRLLRECPFGAVHRLSYQCDRTTDIGSETVSLR